MEELDSSQFHSPERPLPLSDRLVEWAELNRLSGLAMTDVEVFHDITKIIITEVSTSMTINRASQKCFRQG